MNTSIFNDPEANAWLNLSLVPGIGPKTMQAICAANCLACQVYNLDDAQLRELGVPKKSITYLRLYPPNKPSKDVEDTLEWAHKDKHYLLTQLDDAYPSRLLNIASAPSLLMVKGEIEVLKYEQLAIVGSRHPTQAGIAQAYEFAEQLTHMGLTITSGLANGIDASAHNGALQAGGVTLAVLGSGLNKVYPRQNVPLSELICERGALISEFSLNSAAHPGHFPRRNRIVSGLSMGTLVIEATLKSGSLITARQALEQNREVFAIPGPINNPQKSGCHHLIRQGATLVESAEHIAQELRWQHEAQQGLAAVKSKNITTTVDMDPTEQILIKALDYDGANLDELVRRTQLPVSQLNVLLMDFELRGLVRQQQGDYSLI
jgi:DNA processing protein